MKTAYILRACSGSGKSTLAAKLAGENGVVCEADAFFNDKEGNYNFDAKRLPEVHAKCYEMFVNAINFGIDNVVLANTNTQEWEFKKYQEYAEAEGYMVFVMVVENRHGNKNVHNVPDEAVKKMADKITKSIKLY